MVLSGSASRTYFFHGLLEPTCPADKTLGLVGMQTPGNLYEMNILARGLDWPAQHVCIMVTVDNWQLLPTTGGKDYPI